MRRSVRLLTSIASSRTNGTDDAGAYLGVTPIMNCTARVKDTSAEYCRSSLTRAVRTNDRSHVLDDAPARTSRPQRREPQSTS